MWNEKKGRFHESGRNELLFSNGWTLMINKSSNFVCKHDKLTRTISHAFNAFGDEKLKILHSICRNCSFWAHSFTDNCRSFQKYRISLRAKAKNSIFIYLSECAHCTRESDALIFVFLYVESATEQPAKKCTRMHNFNLQAEKFQVFQLHAFVNFFNFDVFRARCWKFSFLKSLKPRNKSLYSFKI